METILANIGTGVISMDVDGQISIINTSAKEMLNSIPKRSWAGVIGRCFGRNI